MKACSVIFRTSYQKSKKFTFLRPSSVLTYPRPTVMSPSLQQSHGLRVAVEGCGHGTLHAIYASVEEACKVRGWERVDLLIIGGDFQAVRNASDLTVMSCPVKFRAIGDFHSYYSGAAKAPYLTLFVGGNHEASSYLWELYYGGWVAPNIYYMGAANVVRLGGVRIAGLTGIWKGYNYKKPHHERLPYSQDDVKSIYHIREIDVRKLLQLRTQVDIGISHDWPRGIEKHGNERQLFRMKPDFAQESKDGTLGNPVAANLMDRLRPPYWFSAHLHCKFNAIKTYEDKEKETAENRETVGQVPKTIGDGALENEASSQLIAHNDDEIDLDMDDDEPLPEAAAAENVQPTASETNTHITQDKSNNGDTSSFSISSEVRAQLPAAFSRGPTSAAPRSTQQNYSTPEGVKNNTVRFLALDKCLPGRKFLQLLEVHPYGTSPESSAENAAQDEDQLPRQTPKFEYDPEWLAITRVFAPNLVLGDKSASLDPDLGESHYLHLIQKEEEWINENVVTKGKLEIPENFEITAPIFQIGTPEIVNDAPREYTNRQTQQFCDLIGIENKFHATEEEREARIRNGPPPQERRDTGFSGRGRGGRGYGRGRGGGRGSRGGRGKW
ncbi:lariat debranching enzyme, C-terminal domain-containing protein [Xylogone sp. PMI_703]|nr:lariat debranching enzyme, C-terminal domain-containing protein [Xylogone sp. PMI_703]